MFAELYPLLAQRSLTITIAALREGQIRVNVIPHSRPEDTKVNEQITYSHKDEVARIPDAAIKALTMPISLTGTAEEIDLRLPSVLLDFVESHVRLQSSFDRASAEIAEAVKAIDERNKAKSKSKAANSKNDSKADANLKSEGDSSKQNQSSCRKMCLPAHRICWRGGRPHVCIACSFLTAPRTVARSAAASVLILLCCGVSGKGPFTCALWLNQLVPRRLLR